MANAPFPIDPHLTAIAVAYRNSAYIADEILPRVPVGKQEFKYDVYPIDETFRLPDTKVGRKGKPNEVDLTASEVTASTEDFGLEDPIPQADIDNAAPGKNPLDRAIMQLSDYIALDREKRTADIVFNANQYAAGNKITLSGTSQFSDFANSDPLGVLIAGMDACLVRPNRVVLGQEVWSKLRQHPKIVKAVLGNAGDSGIARASDLAQLLEVEQVLVGQSRLNTAKKGQAATLARVWGKHALLAHVNKLAATQGSLTFGFTAQWGQRIAGTMEDKNIGLRGGQRARVGESVKELISAANAAYFVENAVA